MSPQDQMPAWLAEQQHGGPPAWLRSKLRGRGTGGHQASAAERAQAWARFEAKRDGARTRPGAPGIVFASLRHPGSVSPLARRVFKVAR